MSEESTARKVWWYVLAASITTLLGGLGTLLFAYVHNWLGISPSGERLGPPAPAVVEGTNRPIRSVRDEMTTVADDLRNADEDHRVYRRYLSLVHLSNNPNVSDADLQAWREAVLDLTEALGGAAQPLDAGNTIYRVDLREWKWDNATWRDVARAYPYALRYAGAEDSTLRQLETEIGDMLDRAPAACVRADWLVAAALRPPLANRLKGGKDAPASVRKQGRAYASTALDLTAVAAEVGTTADELRARVEDHPQLKRDPRLAPLLQPDGRVSREKWESVAEFGSSAFQDLCLGLKIGGPLQIK